VDTTTGIDDGVAGGADDCEAGGDAAGPAVEAADECEERGGRELEIKKLFGAGFG
jgi:hypothetical protein